MRIDKNKLELARARKSISVKEIVAAGIPKVTYYKMRRGENVRPNTAGKLAKVLDVDVLEIIQEEKDGL